MCLLPVRNFWKLGVTVCVEETSVSVLSIFVWCHGYIRHCCLCDYKQSQDSANSIFLQLSFFNIQYVFTSTMLIIYSIVMELNFSLPQMAQVYCLSVHAQCSCCRSTFLQASNWPACLYTYPWNHTRYIWVPYAVIYCPSDWTAPPLATTTAKKTCMICVCAGCLSPKQFGAK